MSCSRFPERREKERESSEGSSESQSSDPSFLYKKIIKIFKLKLWRVYSFNCSFNHPLQRNCSCIRKVKDGNVVEDNLIKCISALSTFAEASHAWLVRRDFSGDIINSSLQIKQKWVKRHVHSHLCPGDHPKKNKGKCKINNYKSVHK